MGTQDTTDGASKALALDALRSEGDDKAGQVDQSILAKSSSLAQRDEADLANLSFKDIEKEFGMDVPDRTDADPALTGDAPAHEIDRRIADGTAQVATEEALAAAAIAAAAPKQDPAPAAAAAAAAAPAAAAPVVEDPPVEQVIETRDGKGKIPYAVLEAARKRVATLESENAELKGQKQVQAEEAAIKGALTPEEIEAMRAEFPEAMVNALVKLNDDNIALKRQNLELQRSAELPGDDPAKLVQDLIDQDPVLSKWQGESLNGDNTNWARATAFDEMLQKDPEWGKKPISERFDQVRALMGAPRQPDPAAKTPAQLAQEAADRAAKAATAAAAAGTSRPHTHSDLPGGNPPAQSDQSQVEQLSTTALEKMFEGKDAAGIDALLARLG